MVAGSARPQGVARVSVYTLDGKDIAVDLEDGLRTRELKRKVAQELRIISEEIDLADGTRVLKNYEQVPHPDETGAPVALTLIRRSRIPGFLQRKGLDSLRARTVDGSTALHLAASMGDVSLCNELLAAPDFSALDAQDFLGNTALHHAAERGLTGVCCAILRHPGFAAVNAVNRNGRSALHIAALRGDAVTCRRVLAHPLARAFEAADALGLTAADLAETAGHGELAARLRAACAGRPQTT